MPFPSGVSNNTELTLRQQLIGAWELVEYSACPKHDPQAKVYPMGKDARGIIMYTETGYMSAQVQTPGQPPFRVNDVKGGDDAEFAEAGRRYLAYTGPFYLHEGEEESILHHHMTSSSFPNWVGSTQRRLIKITRDGDETYLTLSPEKENMVMAQMMVSRLVWRRLATNLATRPP